MLTNAHKHRAAHLTQHYQTDTSLCSLWVRNAFSPQHTQGASAEERFESSGHWKKTLKSLCKVWVCLNKASQLSPGAGAGTGAGGGGRGGGGGGVSRLLLNAVMGTP